MSEGVLRRYANWHWLQLPDPRRGLLSRANPQYKEKLQARSLRAGMGRRGVPSARPHAHMQSVFALPGTNLYRPCCRKWHGLPATKLSGCHHTLACGQTRPI